MNPTSKEENALQVPGLRKRVRFCIERLEERIAPDGAFNENIDGIHIIITPSDNIHVITASA